MSTDAVRLANSLAACAICVGGVQVLLAVAAVVARDACCRRRSNPPTPSP
jgi:hypothetical protein